MIVARWQIEAKFGHKQAVIESFNKWQETFGEEIGWTRDKVRILTGSVGAKESVRISEVTLESMAELDESFGKLATLDGHAAWSAELEPHVVSGTNRWEIYRVI
jgi:hypothetical protein